MVSTARTLRAVATVLHPGLPPVSADWLGMFFRGPREANEWLAFDAGPGEREPAAWREPDRFVEWLDWRDGKLRELGTCGFVIPERVPGENDHNVRTWRERSRLTATWRSYISHALVRENLPVPLPMDGPLRVFLTAWFRTRSGQESENFRPIIAKAFGDALTMGSPFPADGIPGGWLPGGYRGDNDRAWKLSFGISEERAECSSLVARLVWVRPVDDW